MYTQQYLQRKHFGNSTQPSTQTGLFQSRPFSDQNRRIRAKTQPPNLQTQPQRISHHLSQIQVKADAHSEFETRLNRSKNQGSSLPEPVRSFMEPRFNFNFSQVRVHTDHNAVEMNQELNSHAFTQGSDIYFGEGNTPDISMLTAHELTHVVQQSCDRPQIQRWSLGDLLDDTWNYLQDSWNAVQDWLTPGEVQTVSDRLAIIRTEPPDLDSTGEIIPKGSQVKILETYKGDTQYVRVEEVLPEGTSGEPKIWGWTKASNLSPAKKSKSSDTPTPRSEAEILAEIAEARRSAELTEVWQLETLFVNPQVFAFLRSIPGSKRSPYKNCLKKLNGLLRKRAVLQHESKDDSYIAKLNKKLERDIKKIEKKEKKGKLTAEEAEKLINDLKAANEESKTHSQALESLREEIEQEEDAIAEVLEAKKEATKNSKDKANWERFIELSEAGLVQTTNTTKWQVLFEGETEEIELTPAKPGGYLLERPGGYAGGGRTTYSQENIDEVLDEVYDSEDPDQKQQQNMAKKLLGTLSKNEGRADSINTWDRAIVTLGSGIAGFGRLQKTFWEYKQSAPGDFQETVGKFGIDIVKRSRNSNPYFTVRVPPEEVRTDSQREIPSGTLIEGSDSSKETCQALDFIASDPVLLARLRYAGCQDAFQKILIKEAVGSAQKASGYGFEIDLPDGTTFRVNWADLIKDLGDDYLEFTQAIIADRYHGYGNFDIVTNAVKPEYLALMQAKSPDDLSNFSVLSSDDLMKLAKKVASTLPSRRYGGFRTEFPDLADELFSNKKSSQKQDDEEDSDEEN